MTVRRGAGGRSQWDTVLCPALLGTAVLTAPVGCACGATTSRCVSTGTPTWPPSPTASAWTGPRISSSVRKRIIPPWFPACARVMTPAQTARIILPVGGVIRVTRMAWGSVMKEGHLAPYSELLFTTRTKIPPLLYQRLGHGLGPTAPSALPRRRSGTSPPAPCASVTATQSAPPLVFASSRVNTTHRATIARGAARDSLAIL